MKWLLGIDIGGTTVKMAILDLQGIIVEKWEIETVILNDGEQIPGDIATSFFEKCKESNKRPEDFVGAGIGAPGFIDFNTGVVERAVNIGWNNFELIGEFERLTGLPAVIENDANAAAIGEMWKGAGSGATELLAVTLGTGVGGGLITNGQIVHGTVGMAGEIGHITMLAEGGVLCGCGRRGCLETIASATGVARLGLEKRKGQQTVLNDIQAVTAKDVFDAYTKGDRIATEVVEEVTFHLGLAISNLANSINPEMIVIGGGVSKAGDALMVPLKKQFERFALPRVFESTTFKIAELENDAGVIGCAWLAKQMFLKK